MSLAYSMCLVVVTVYNLPSCLCMKPEYLMLNLLIPCPKVLDKDIDVFLRPLVDELKELWTNGINTRDTETNNRCNGRQRITENNVTSIDISAEAFKDDQFILASQAQQVFYIKDSSRARPSAAVPSTAAIQVGTKSGALNQFSGDSQNDDQRFPMYEAQLRRIERTIQHLTANLKNRIPEVVPKEDEDDDDSGGLGNL
ncbi:Uncharacterized protein Adt_18054 [Abeliophyllum distichum]|uniref:DUF4216 domain-containing protein n=1 Tax=Abeliophyllum distichum TaxID=126358 RepID=A0ABD1TIG0_9LAMI